MAHLEFCDTHNMVAFLNKSEGSEDFPQIIDFLNLSHIKYTLIENPTIYTLLIQQFLETAFASTSENEEMEITATINGRVKTITEASIRRHLKLEDSDGIPTLPNAEIFKQLALIGPKKTAWEQFSSNIATLYMLLSDQIRLSTSKMIFEGMLKNLDSRSKFLMYPRFIQIFLNKHKRHLLSHKRTYVAPTLTQKLFSNIRRVSKGYTGVNIPLFPTMLTTPESSPSRITSSPSLSPQTHPSTSQQPPTPPFMQTIHDEEEPITMPHDSSQPSQDVEHKVKASKSRRRTKIVVSDDEEVSEDPSKQGRIIAEIDQNPSISLVQYEGTSWIKEDVETQGRTFRPRRTD
ncbi:hypothetical protein Tco_0854432 [Tanacetum coccineum]